MDLTNEQLVKLLKGQLHIKAKFKEGGSAYWSGDHELIIELKVGNTVISDTTVYLPNHDRQSEF